jgi:hypothetical protein
MEGMKLQDLCLPQRAASGLLALATISVLACASEDAATEVPGANLGPQLGTQQAPISVTSPGLSVRLAPLAHRGVSGARLGVFSDYRENNMYKNVLGSTLAGTLEVVLTPVAGREAEFRVSLSPNIQDLLSLWCTSSDAYRTFSCRTGGGTGGGAFADSEGRWSVQSGNREHRVLVGNPRRENFPFTVAEGPCAGMSVDYESNRFALGVFCWWNDSYSAEVVGAPVIPFVQVPAADAGVAVDAGATVPATGDAATRPDSTAPSGDADPENVVDACGRVLPASDATVSRSEAAASEPSGDLGLPAAAREVSEVRAPAAQGCSLAGNGTSGVSSFAAVALAGLLLRTRRDLRTGQRLRARRFC